MKLGRPQGNNRRTAEALGIGQREFRAIAARWPQMSPLARIYIVNEIKRNTLRSKRSEGTQNG